MEKDIKIWLLEKWHAWEVQSREKRSEAQFAQYLGVDKKALNHWMNGRNQPSFQSAQKHLSNKTLLNYHTGLSALYTWAVSEGYASEQHMHGIDRPRPEQRIIQPILIIRANLIHFLNICQQLVYAL